MITKNLLFIAILLFGHDYSIGQEVRNDSLIGPAASQEFELCYSTKCIKKSFKRYLKKENIKLELAEPGESYNKTDLNVEGLKNRRLIFSGLGSNGINFILYECGGNAIQYVALIFKKRANMNYEIKIIRFNNEILSIDDFKLSINEKAYTILR